MRLRLILLFLLFGSFSLNAMEWWSCYGITAQVDLEYLHAWRKERESPQLLTTAPGGVSPALDGPETTLLFGGNYGDSPQPGVRGTAQLWRCGDLGYGIGGFWIADEANSVSVASDAAGVPSIGIPYYELFSGVEATTFVAFEDQFSGSARVKAKNGVWGANAFVKWSMVDCPAYAWNLLCGYQHYSINDRIRLSASASSLVEESEWEINNRFYCWNNFDGGYLGLEGDLQSGRFGFSLLGQISLGYMGSRTKIKGFGEITPVTGEFIGFVQDSNRGSYRRGCFSAVPEVAARVRYCICNGAEVTLGYTFVYWDEVWLAAEQIDRRLNSFVAGELPKFLDRKRNFWLQALTVGFRGHY